MGNNGKAGATSAPAPAGAVGDDEKIYIRAFSFMQASQFSTHRRTSRKTC